MIDDATALSSYWHTEIEMARESGAQALVGLGTDSSHPVNLAALLSLRQMLRRVSRAEQPVAIIGGEGELWLLAASLLASHGLAKPVVSAVAPSAVAAGPHPLAIYGGTDQATYGASLLIGAPTLTTARLDGGGASPIASGDIQHRNLSIGASWMVTPLALPGSHFGTLETLPFALPESPLAGAYIRGVSNSALPESSSDGVRLPGFVQLEGWITLFFVLGMVAWAILSGIL